MTNPSLENALLGLVDQLRSVGLNEGDCVLVHSNTDSLAKLDDEIAVDPFLGMKVLREALLRAVGENGTVIVPTFTFSFCQGRFYDPLKRSSEVGLFSNFFMKSEGAIRSHHPIFSFSATGREAAELMNDVPSTAYGKGSVFDRFRQLNGKILFFNVPFQCCTFVHHIEEMHGVDYRYMKKFEGKIRVDGEYFDCVAEFFVRDLERDVKSGFESFEIKIRDKGIIRYEETCTGRIGLCSSQNLFEFGIRVLDSHPHIFLAQPPLENNQDHG